MDKSDISKFFRALVLTAALAILILFGTATAVNYVPDWVVSGLFVWAMFIAGFLIGRLNK